MVNSLKPQNEAEITVTWGERNSFSIIQVKNDISCFWWSKESERQESVINDDHDDMITLNM
jgi:hypothetical protein